MVVHDSHGLQNSNPNFIVTNGYRASYGDKRDRGLCDNLLCHKRLAKLTTLRSTKRFSGFCTGETYKSVVKMTFAKGAALKDPSGLFNSTLDGNTRRAIDFHEGEKIDEEALKTLVRAAVTLNKSKAKS